MANKFTISEVYENESNRVQADQTNPINDDTLMLVSENDNGTYKTKALDYGTLQQSLYASLDIENITNNTTVNNYGDTLGISGDYPCFFEMYSSYHYNSGGTNDPYSQDDINNDYGTTKGLYGKTWSGDSLMNSVNSDGTLYNKVQYGGNSPVNNLNNTYLSGYTCLKPFKIFANEHPDPQLVTVVIVSKYSGGVYFEHNIDASSWQRIPIFTYNPDANSDIATFKFIATPGSRFGIFGKSGTGNNTFFGPNTTIIITLTNTKGRLTNIKEYMQFSGTYWSSVLSTDDVTQPDGQTTSFEPSMFHVYGPVVGNINTGVACLMARNGATGKWSVIATKIYDRQNTKIAKYIDFGNFYIEKGTQMVCWVSDPDLVLKGTTTINGSSQINGGLYLKRESTNKNQINKPLKLTIKPNRTPSNTPGRNIQFKLYGSGVITNNITVKTSGVSMYHEVQGVQDFRYYIPLANNQNAVHDSPVEITIDCANLAKTNPLMFYVKTPTVNTTNEFRGSTSDGQYSGIQSIDGTDSACDFTTLSNNFAYNCTNLETVKFNNNLTTIKNESFSGCSALKTVSMPGVQDIGSKSFYGCSALTGFNVDSDGYSVIPSNATVGANAFDQVAINNLKISQTENSNLANNAFNKMTITNCKIDYSKYDTNRPIANTNITNLSITLNTAQSGSYIPLVNNNCSVVNLSVFSSSDNGTFKSKLTNYDVQSVYMKNCRTLSNGALSSSTTLKTLKLENSNVPEHFCTNCKELNNVSGNLLTIGDYAFSNCINLSNLEIGNTTSIGDYAFNNCSALSTLSFPSTLTSIGKRAFNACSSLVGTGVDGRIDISNLSSIGNDRVFNGTAIKQVLFGSQLSNGLNSYTFQGCENLTKLYFKHVASDDTKKTLYTILMGSKNTQKISVGDTKTSNICKDTSQTIEVYYNCTGFADSQFKFATITGTKIQFAVEIPK